MFKLLKTLTICLLVNITIAGNAHAFFPPFFIGTEFTAKVNRITEKVARVQNTYIQIKRYQHQFQTLRKQGLMGFVKMVAFTVVDIKFRKKRKRETKIPDFMKDSINKGSDAGIGAIEANLIPKVDSKSNQTEKLNENEIKNIQMKNQILSEIYAKALTIRTNIAKEREEPPMNIDAKDSRELLTATRKFIEKNAYRLNNILRMEAQIMELEAYDEVTDINKLKIGE